MRAVLRLLHGSCATVTSAAGAGRVRVVQLLFVPALEDGEPRGDQRRRRGVHADAAHGAADAVMAPACAPGGWRQH